METKVNYTLAGTFVLVLLGFIIFAIIWLAGAFTTDKFSYYKVHMKESVSGLNIDAPIEFNGVNVGTVAEMKINQENPQLVELLIKIKSDTPITMGTRAKLSMRALSGIAFLLLEDKGTDRRPLAIAQGEKYAVIPTTPSILVRLDTILTQLTDSFAQVSHSIQSLLDEQNLKWIKQILYSGQGSMRVIQTQTIPATNQAISNIGNITRDLSTLSKELKRNPSVIIRGKAPSDKLGPGER